MGKRDWRDGSAIKEYSSYLQRTEVHSQHPHGSSNYLQLYFLRILASSGTAYAFDTYIHMQANPHIHQIKINLFKSEKCVGKAQNSLKEAEGEANDYSGYVVNYGVGG